MDLLKYLEPMKNLPERFSNLAFWRGVRKLRDEVVNAFEYVDSWGEHMESQLDNIPYHNEYPYQFLKNGSTRIVTPISILVSVNAYVAPHIYNGTHVPDTYVFDTHYGASMMFTSSQFFKPENLYIRGIHLDIILTTPDLPGKVYKQWSIFTNESIKDYILTSDGRITGIKTRGTLNVFTLPGIDSDIASEKTMHTFLTFDAFDA